jgi:hypothetical protein
MDLSSGERRMLEAVARMYTSPYCDMIRAKIILLADEGLSNDVIAFGRRKEFSVTELRQRKEFQLRNFAPSTIRYYN